MFMYYDLWPTDSKIKQQTDLLLKTLRYLEKLCKSDLLKNMYVHELFFNFFQGKHNQAKYAASIGPKILKFYEDYFDLPFPLPKMDNAAIPDFNGGIYNCQKYI